MKYLLKQNKEDEGILCDKVTIDGFDYYVNTNHKSSKGYYLTENRFLVLILKEHAHSEMFSYEGQIVSTGVYVNFINIDKFSKVIATNNPNIDIPKVVDVVENIAYSWLYEEETEIKARQGYPLKPMEYGFIEGYNKSQEAHPFSEDDMIEFLTFVENNYYYNSGCWINSETDDIIHRNELLQIWKEQKPKIVYYE